MAMQLPFDQMTPEEQREILNIREQRRRDIVRNNRLVSVRHRIVELWCCFLFFFTCRSAGGLCADSMIIIIQLFWQCFMVPLLWLDYGQKPRVV